VIVRRITALCSGCGNAVRTDLHDTDPPGTARIETSACNLCDDGGGFPLAYHFALDGRELEPL